VSCGVEREELQERVETKRTADVDGTAQALWAAAHGITSLMIQRPKFPWAERNKVINQVLDSVVDSLVR